MVHLRGKAVLFVNLVHWPIYTIIMMRFSGNILSLHFGVVIAFVMSVVLTETFEKAYLQANMRIIFSLIICLYAFIAVFYMSESSRKSLNNDTQWITELLTPVCTPEKLQSREICDIPIDRMNLYTEDVIRINEWGSLNDENLLFYAKCSYRRSPGPWEWCDLPSENQASSHKILVIGNSYAANQGRIVHESCASSDVEVKIYSEPGCELLIETMSFNNCPGSHSRFHNAVREYRPNVVFILARQIDLSTKAMRASNETIALMVNNAVAILHDLEKLVTDRIFVLNIFPVQKTTFETEHAAALRAGKVMDQNSFLTREVDLAPTREIVERAVASCTKCTMIDYTPVFTENGTFQSFSEQSHIAYFSINLHLTPYGLHRLRPFFKQICSNISYSSHFSS